LTTACREHADPDAAALTRAWRYAALQPFIVDKRPLFDEAIRLVDDGGTSPAAVLELGVGTGGFLEAVAVAGAWPGARLIGADLSEARLVVARTVLSSVGRAVDLHGAVNALDAASAFYHRRVPPGSMDVVVLSQFEHYAPNHRTSPLADRLARLGGAWCSKPELRRLAVSLLRPGGWLILIDDYAADSPAQQAAWDQAWDAHVVRSLASHEAREALGAVDPVGAEALLCRYRDTRPWVARLALAARARSRRRHRDGEEVEALGAARRDFEQLFGADGCGVVAHPNAAAHPQFYLLWGRRPVE